MKIIIAFFTLLITSNLAYGSSMGIDKFSGSETLIDFNLLPDGTKLNRQFSKTGIIFKNNSRFTEISESTFGGTVTPKAAFARLNTGGFQEFLFTIPVNLFGLELDGSEGKTFIMNVYGHSGLIESLNGANNSFLGVEADTDITRIELSTSISGFNFAFDDVRFEGNLESTPDPVPVPTAIWLLSSGLIGLLGMKKGIKFSVLLS